MKDIKEVYPDCGDDYFSAPYDYRPLLQSLAFAILLQVDDNDYSGDSRLLLADGPRRGYLQFGWGSCSGCDALQDARSYADLEELRTSLRGAIRWFDDAAAALAWFESHDWEGDYSWHRDEQHQFTAQAAALLKDPA